MSNDLIAGCLGGMVKTLIAQPFDTLKVRHQCRATYPLTFTGLYRGMAFPMLSNTVFQGLSLSIQRRINDKIDNHGLAGALTGAICCAFTCPLDSWKVARQNRDKVLLRNAYRGMCSSIMRESVASCAFFATYGKLQRMTGNTTAAGAIGGLTATLVSLPLDTVRTRLQAGQPIRTAIGNGQYHAGFHFVVMKALMTNAACYFVYGHIRDRLTKNPQNPGFKNSSKKCTFEAERSQSSR